MFVSSCSAGTGGDIPTLVAQDGDIVELHYVLTDTDGSVIDSSRDAGVPFSFTVGSGRVIPGFNNAVRGLTVGEVRTVEIDPENGYGLRDDAKIIEVPIAPSQSDVAVGDVVFVNNAQRGTVIAIEGGMATVDTNDELAGKVLTFEIEILAITRG